MSANRLSSRQAPCGRNGRRAGRSVAKSSSAPSARRDFSDLEFRSFLRVVETSVEVREDRECAEKSPRTVLHRWNSRSFQIVPGNFPRCEEKKNETQRAPVVGKKARFNALREAEHDSETGTDDARRTGTPEEDADDDDDDDRSHDSSQARAPRSRDACEKNERLSRETECPRTFPKVARALSLSLSLSRARHAQCAKGVCVCSVASPRLLFQKLSLRKRALSSLSKSLAERQRRAPDRRERCAFRSLSLVSLVSDSDDPQFTRARRGLWLSLEQPRYVTKSLEARLRTHSQNSTEI